MKDKGEDEGTKKMDEDDVVSWVIEEENKGWDGAWDGIWRMRGEDEGKVWERRKRMGKDEEKSLDMWREYGRMMEEGEEGRGRWRGATWCSRVMKDTTTYH